MITSMILFPLVGFVINGLWSLWSARSGRRVPPSVSGAIATLAMAAAFVSALVARSQLPSDGAIEVECFRWFTLGTLAVDFKLRLDALSSLFTLVITGVGTLIHLYSISYMSEDEGAGKYFAYLNLFCFMMLNLVLGSTLPQVFLGWEGVGLASYLLIGFWYREEANVSAGQKAFVMNRIGDLGFLIAMFIGFKYSGSLDLAVIEKAVLPGAVATSFVLLVFLACTGKSAQIPLFTWLPDAMAGPTPVSALIHAATMVTSGVYLLARLSPVISQSASGMMVIAGVGAITALITAVIACFQRDIKKVLAYSTVSQLGFMFAACGVGAFGAGVFHVMTHAFFKALLFLGAGSVIHALHGEQDVFKMGGLKSKLPVTFWTFTAGWAAILGLPPFSGFFSKDEILHQALVSRSGSGWVFGILLIAAVLTAFYMTRLYLLVFFGSPRMEKSKFDHAHESPAPMALPLVLLGALSLAGGFAGEPVHLPHPEAALSTPAWVIMIVSVVVAVLGATIAYRRYAGGSASAEPATDVFRIDAIYSRVFGGGLRATASATGWIEERVVQGLIRMVAALTDLSGNMIRVLQVGSAQAYLLMMVIALVVMVLYFLKGMVQYGNL
jgi:NADH-quinone oxidoreductase subunit L